jgi:probable HAF family extracellular repeat protein
MVGLGDLPGGGFESIALGVSGDGRTVVGWSQTASGLEAFLWYPDIGMQSLKDTLIAQGIDLTGWTLNYATGISADGLTIVGGGKNPAGLVEAFVAILDD